MFLSAAVGIGVNLYIALGLRAEGGENLNVLGAMLHAMGDIGASVGVILGGLIILLTGWQYADPLISLAIAVLVAKSAWELLGETVDILMEATPKDLNVAQLVRDVVKVPGVEDMHDLQVWCIACGMKLLSAHVQVTDNRPLTECDTLVDQIHCLLCEQYGIQHTTVQLERVGYVERDLYCACRRAATLLGLCLYIVLNTGEGLLHQIHPEAVPVGMLLAVVAVIGMPLLAQRKRVLADQLGSAALRGDAACSMTCAAMAATLLVGLSLHALFG